MLKRVAVLGAGDAFYKSILSAAEGTEAEVLGLPAGAELPAATSAVLCGAGDPAGMVEAALRMGERNEEMLKLLAMAIDCREGFLTNSSLRVMEHASRFAQALGLSPDDQLTLERGALVRDVGKIEIPNDVLLKEDVLSYDDWTSLQRHPHLGADLVRGTGALKDVADIVRDHHECYDGDGYPEGLEGDEISQMARIMRILDVYCAMTSPRHYRMGHASHEDAIAHLRDERGKHFDPGLIDVFIDANVGRTVPA